MVFPLCLDDRDEITLRLQETEMAEAIIEYGRKLFEQGVPHEQL